MRTMESADAEMDNARAMSGPVIGRPRHARPQLAEPGSGEPPAHSL
jgi:hypothetical protein